MFHLNSQIEIRVSSQQILANLNTSVVGIRGRGGLTPRSKVAGLVFLS